MSIHRHERPDAPARVRKSALRPDRWAWRCMDKPTHHENGYPSWDDAWAAMEKHRVNAHGHANGYHLFGSHWKVCAACAEIAGEPAPTKTEPYVLDERVPRFTEDDVEMVERGDSRRIAELVRQEYFATPRCVCCGTRKDRPENVCRGSHSISMYHTYSDGTTPGFPAVTTPYSELADAPDWDD